MKILIELQLHSDITKCLLTFGRIHLPHGAVNLLFPEFLAWVYRFRLLLQEIAQNFTYKITFDIYVICADIDNQGTFLSRVCIL